MVTAEEARAAAKPQSTYSYESIDRNGLRIIYVYKKNARYTDGQKDKLISKTTIRGDVAERTRFYSDRKKTEETKAQAPAPVPRSAPSGSPQPSRETLKAAQTTLRQLNESAQRSGSSVRYKLTLNEKTGDYEITKGNTTIKNIKNNDNLLTPEELLIKRNLNLSRPKQINTFTEYEGATKGGTISDKPIQINYTAPRDRGINDFFRNAQQSLIEIRAENRRNAPAGSYAPFAINKYTVSDAILSFGVGGFFALGALKPTAKDNTLISFARSIFSEVKETGGLPYTAEALSKEIDRHPISFLSEQTGTYAANLGLTSALSGRARFPEISLRETPLSQDSTGVLRGSNRRTTKAEIRKKSFGASYNPTIARDANTMRILTPSSFKGVEYLQEQNILRVTDLKLKKTGEGTAFAGRQFDLSLQGGKVSFSRRVADILPKGAENSLTKSSTGFNYNKRLISQAPKTKYSAAAGEQFIEQLKLLNQQRSFNAAQKTGSVPEPFTPKQKINNNFETIGIYELQPNVKVQESQFIEGKVITQRRGVTSGREGIYQAIYNKLQNKKYVFGDLTPQYQQPLLPITEANYLKDLTPTTASTNNLLIITKNNALNIVFTPNEFIKTISPTYAPQTLPSATILSLSQDKIINTVSILKPNTKPDLPLITESKQILYTGFKPTDKSALKSYQTNKQNSAIVTAVDTNKVLETSSSNKIIFVTPKIPPPQEPTKEKEPPSFIPHINPIIPPPRIPNPINPKPKIEPDLIETTIKPPSSKNKSALGFNVFVRRGGKFNKINSLPLTKNAALNLGARVVGNTAAASFKLGKALTPASNLGFGGTPQLKNFYSKNGLFIEKRGKRIKSAGELREITFKGLNVLKNKKSSKRFKFPKLGGNLLK